ncbi:MAG: NAD(P)/FAD-dependent oxidoreductase [Thermoleophilia bacterium]
MDRFDVIIVGAGPAGIFAALELSRTSDLSILLLEKGCDISERRCPAQRTGRCTHCEPCDITCGWGGAGAFSDGKLTLSPEVGGWLGDYLEPGVLESLIADVDLVWREFGAPEKVHGDDAEVAEAWRIRARKEGLRLVYSPIRHMGTERCDDVLRGMHAGLEDRVHILTETPVVSVLTDEAANGTRRTRGVLTSDGREFESPVVIVAPGREGAAWLLDEANRLGLSVTSNAVDIGVRVEVPAVVTEAITDDLYEPKLLYVSRHFEDPVRTFCLNPYGVVSKESYGDVVTVNGHSYGGDGRRTPYTNFALLVSTRFTEPFKEPIAYGKSIARLANILGKDIIVQRLGDLLAGRRTTRERLARGVVQPTLGEVTPGDLSFALPYRHLRDILDMLEALDRLLPGVGGRDTLLYGVEVKFYSSRLQLDRHLRTTVAGLYAVGDGAGVTRGLVQASASGLVAARSVLGLSG